MRSYEGAGQVDFGPDTGWSTQVMDDTDPLGNPVRFWKDDYLDHAGLGPLRQGEQPPCVGPVRGGGARRKARHRGVDEDRGQIVAFPRYAILAGYIHGKNSGGHGGRPLVNSTGSLGVAVRCSQAPQSSCIDLNPTKGPQLQPPGNYQLQYPNSIAIDQEEMIALEKWPRRTALGTKVARRIRTVMSCT